MALFKPHHFYTTALARDFSRQYQLRVINIGNLFGPDDNVFLEAHSLPQYEVGNIKTPFMGMDFNIPGHGKYPGSDAYKIVFRCDLSFDIRNLMELWQRSVFNAIPMTNAAGDSGGTGDYHIPDAGWQLIMGLHDRTDTDTFYRIYTLNGVYPTMIESMEYNQSSAEGGTIVKLPVTLAYQWWSLTTNTLPVDRKLAPGAIEGYASE